MVLESVGHLWQDELLPVTQLPRPRKEGFSVEARGGNGYCRSAPGKRLHLKPGELSLERQPGQPPSVASSPFGERPSFDLLAGLQPVDEKGAAQRRSSEQPEPATTEDHCGERYRGQDAELESMQPGHLAFERELRR